MRGLELELRIDVSSLFTTGAFIRSTRWLEVAF
jgi:hypothetical protein